MLDQLLLPQRLTVRALEDLHRIAEAVLHVGAAAREITRRIDPLADRLGPLADELQDAFGTFRSLRDEVAGVRRAVDPMVGQLDALRVEFGGANDEIQALREAFTPELEALRRAAEGMHGEVRQMREQMVTLDVDLREMGHRLTEQMASLNRTFSQLAHDVDEVRDVVEPLQTATERVGRVAERLPGSGRKR